MRVAIGSDHAGVTLKSAIVSHFEKSGIAHRDFGTADGQAVDYPDIATDVARAVRGGEYDLGIVICGTGIGSSIAANKVPGIRAALCYDSFCARMSREHNDANVLCLGGRVTGPELALDIVKVFLSTAFSTDERHARRVGKLADLDGTK